MAVYYRYRSGVDTFSVPVPAPSIPVADLKRLILGTARHGHGRTRGRGQRESVAIYDSTTGEEYADDSALVPRGSAVLVRRIAGPPAEAITFGSPSPPKSTPTTRDGASSDSAVTSSSPAAAEDDEDRAINAVIDAAQLKWEDQHRWRRWSNRGALEGGSRPAPPAGYVCHRCRVPGHLIQHCPTNGDPRYDLLPSAPSNTNLPTASPASSTPDDGVPPDLHCKICNKVMSDAVVASRCCFGSFCDACIRGQIAAAKSRCVCGGQARADDLIPNLTLRATIAKLLATKAAAGSGPASTDNRKSSAGSNAAEPTSRSPAASQENLSHASTTAGPENSDGNASSSSTSTSAAAPPAAREKPASTKQTTTDSQGIAAPTGYPEQYGYGGPPIGGPACYDPLVGATTPWPWACDPFTYYAMPYGGGGYMNAPAPGGGYCDGWGWHGRKRTADGEHQRHAESGFKRRCRIRPEFAV